MSEPLNTYTLEHYLNFKSDSTGLIRIDEPIGFDAANFVIEQDKGRYGRDISFAGEEIDFTFSPVITRYGHQFEKLIEYDKIYGYESKVEYILREGSTDYVVGMIDFYSKQTDQTTEFSCVFIQDVSQTLLKRRIDVKVNVFNNKDLSNKDLEPLQTTNILLKAKPIVQNSEWISPTPINEDMVVSSASIIGGASTSYYYYNNCERYVLFGIENTLTFLDIFLKSDTENEDLSLAEKFKYVQAVNKLTNVKVKITNLILNQVITTRRGGNGYTNNYFRVLAGSDFNNPTFIQDVFNVFSTDSDGGFNIDIPEQTIEIPLLEVGDSIWIYMRSEVRQSSASPFAEIKAVTSVNEYGIEMTATSIAIDSVVKGVRLIDAMKQVSKSINQDFVLNAPRFDVGGEWYNNFIFSGNMIRGRNSEYPISWKNTTNWLQEFNSDYEINNNSLSVLKYDDFYRNIDMGAFLLAPDDSFNLSYNELYAINRFVFKYNKFNQDKDDSNTIDSVHTEAEFLNANESIENFKEIKLEQIRDPFELETTRRKSIITKETTSLTQDDKTFMSDCVSLAPSTRGGFKDVITHFVNANGDLQLLNNNTFNWSLLGFGLSSPFKIENTDNEGNYIVTELTSSSIITLTPQDVTPQRLDEQITEVSYPFDNVNFTIRTNEGFNIIENILSPNDYGNLLYTPKRNILNNWGSYLKTASKYKPTTIINTYFKNSPADENGLKLPNLTTRFGTGELITENADIEQSELSEALLTPEEITTTLLCSFSQFRELAEKIKTERGFIRVYDNELRVRKIFLKKTDFTWADNVLEVMSEVKFESETLDIVFEDGIYYINEVGYDQDIIPHLDYISTNDNIQFFDIRTRPLTNKTRFDFVSLNGVIYDTINELEAAILAL